MVYENLNFYYICKETFNKMNVYGNIFIICPHCKNDKEFKLIADKLEPGIYEMKIGCGKCNWISDDIYEDCGYFPNMSTEMITYCVHDLHEQQKD